VKKVQKKKITKNSHQQYVETWYAKCLWYIIDRLQSMVPVSVKIVLC